MAPGPEHSATATQSPSNFQELIISKIFLEIACGQLSEPTIHRWAEGHETLMPDFEGQLCLRYVTRLMKTADSKMRRPDEDAKQNNCEGRKSRELRIWVKP